MSEIKKIVVVTLPHNEAIVKAAEQNWNVVQRQMPTSKKSWEEQPLYVHLEYRLHTHAMFLTTGRNYLPTFPDHEWYAHEEMGYHEDNGYATDFATAVMNNNQQVKDIVDGLIAKVDVLRLPQIRNGVLNMVDLANKAGTLSFRDIDIDVTASYPSFKSKPCPPARFIIDPVVLHPLNFGDMKINLDVPTLDLVKSDGTRPTIKVEPSTKSKSSKTYYSSKLSYTPSVVTKKRSIPIN